MQENQIGDSKHTDSLEQKSQIVHNDTQVDESILQREETLHHAHENDALDKEHLSNNNGSQNINSSVTEKTEIKKTIDKEPPTKKKKNPILRFFKILFMLLLCLIGALLIWVGYATFFSDSIEEHVPENVSLYASVPSASKLLSDTLELQALDELFSDPSMADIYSLIKVLRSNDFISSPFFSFLANIRLDAAVYTNTNEQNPNSEQFEIYAFADLGFRSSITRLLPIALKLKPSLVYDFEIDELDTHTDEQGRYFSFQLSESSYVVFRFYKNLLLAKLHNGTLDDLDFTSIISKNSEKFRKSLKKDLQQNKQGAINILADLNHSKKTLVSNNTTLETILNEITFPERSNINIQVQNQSLKVAGDLKLKTEHTQLASILNTKASVPKAYNRLPDTTEYFTLLNFQTPKELLENLDPFLPTDIKNTYKSANNLVRTLLGGTIEDLILSWFGEELGVFAVDGVDAPIFFTSISDKQKCNAFFTKLFSSILIDQNSSTVVDDIRISRIVFPPLVTALLKLFKIDLPTPFYFIDGDFVFFSESSEGIARYKQSVNESKVITKNEKWKSILKQSTSETSFVLYYDMERSVPFFLQSNQTLNSILSHYGSGLLSFKLHGNQNSSFSLYAVKQEAAPLRRVASFPKQMEGKLFGELHYAKTRSGSPFLFWSIGERLYSFDLTNDKVTSIKVDSNASITIHKQNDRLKAVWALTKNGTVYRLDENLNSYSPFPLLTSIKSIGEPVVFNDTLIFSSQEDTELVYITEQGEISYSQPMHTTMKTAPSVYEDVIVALPRSFDSTVYFFDSMGMEKYPCIELESISAIKPLLFKNTKNELVIANITEDGLFTLDYVDPNQPTGIDRQIIMQKLNFSCQIQPIYSPTLNAILVIDSDGILHILQLDGREKTSTKLAYKDVNMRITVQDITNDGLDEIFVSGGGNAVYAYTNTLMLIDGFPISGTSNPIFTDVNADGRNDILTFSIDGKIHAFEGFIKK